MAGAANGGKLKLQPLPKKLSEEKKENQNNGKDGSKTKSTSSKGAQIEPRRIALNFGAQTIVLEYKEQGTGKLRHRSFRIDIGRFESAEECQDKLWGRIKKTVVPGTLQPDQIKRLVAKLFASIRSRSPDQDEIEAATKQLMNAEVSKPEPTPGVGQGVNDSDSSLEQASSKAGESCESTGPTPPGPEQEQSLSSLSGLPSLGGKRDDSLSSLAGLPSLGGAKKPISLDSEPAPVLAPTTKDDDGKKDVADDLLGADEISEEEIPDYADDFEDVEESPVPTRGKEDHLSEGEDEEARQIEITRKLAGDDVDLQNVDPDELVDYKAQMEVEFEKRAIKPGDPRFQHDVQMDFSEPEEDAGWDEEDDYVPSDDDDNF